jgi:hypothetical protein
MPRTLKVQSQKPSGAMMKLAIMCAVTGMEDPELPLTQGIRSLELTTPQIAAQINASQSSTDTSQHQLFRGDCVNQVEICIGVCLCAWLSLRKKGLSGT